MPVQAVAHERRSVVAVRSVPSGPVASKERPRTTAAVRPASTELSLSEIDQRLAALRDAEHTLERARLAAIDADVDDLVSSFVD